MPVRGTATTISTGCIKEDGLLGARILAVQALNALFCVARSYLFIDSHFLLILGSLVAHAESLSAYFARRHPDVTRQHPDAALSR